MTIEKISYIIRYIRQGETNQWKAKATTEEGIKTNISERAHSSFTAQFQDQTKEDQISQSIYVTIKRDPRYFDMSRELEEALITMREEAYQMADKIFLKKHPDAIIEYYREI